MFQIECVVFMDRVIGDMDMGMIADGDCSVSLDLLYGVNRIVWLGYT